MYKKAYLSIAEGVLRGFILTLILILIFAAVMSFTEVSPDVSSVFYMVTTLISVMYGTIYAVRKIKRRGWIVGASVSMLYMLILYIIYIIGGRDSSILNSGMYIRILLALAVGILSGMLGINI